MNRKEALQILDLAEEASREEIQSKYQERFSRLQVQITNAPDESLRLKYQHTLGQVKQAYEVMTSGAADKSHLPSTSPVAQSAPIAQAVPESSDLSKKATPAVSDKSDKSDKRFRIVFFWALLATVLAVMMTLLYSSIKKEMEEKTTQLINLQAKAAVLGQISPSHDKAFTIKNTLSEDIEITRLEIWYQKDSILNFISFIENDSSFIPLKAGSSFEAIKRKDNKKIFDGTGVLVFRIMYQADSFDCAQVFAGPNNSDVNNVFEIGD